MSTAQTNAIDASLQELISHIKTTYKTITLENVISVVKDSIQIVSTYTNLTTTQRKGAIVNAITSLIPSEDFVLIVVAQKLLPEAITLASDVVVRIENSGFFKKYFCCCCKK